MNKLKVSGVARVDDPRPRIRVELSGVAYFDAEDVAALNDLMALPPPKPPVFSPEEQRRHAVEFDRKQAREREAQAAQRAADEARLRDQTFDAALHSLTPVAPVA